MHNGRPTSHSFHIITAGCKVNQYESEMMREELIAAGWAERPDEPDVVVVNTCTVTHRADAKARRAIRRAAREHPGCRIAVTGCAVERDRGFCDGLPGVWRVLGNDAKPFIAQALAGENGHLSAEARPFGRGISGFSGHTRAFVKVQDGCSAGCTYCIVPAVRGRERSRPSGEVVAEVARLAGRFHEIVLTGIHLGRYEDPDAGIGLAGLASRLLDDTPIERLRLSSIEPGEVTDELISLCARSDRLCPHFHVPLQSGSDRVLGRMNRPYTAAEYLALLDRLRGELDRPAVSTDVMVGFPGETAADFGRTLAVCEQAQFARIHVFPYSDRPGTAASKLPDKVHDADVSDRKAQLEERADQLALEYKRRFVGRTLSVLVESRCDRTGTLSGYCPRYLRVRFEGPAEMVGRVRPALITGARPDILLGQAEHA